MLKQYGIKIKLLNLKAVWEFTGVTTKLVETAAIPNC